MKSLKFPITIISTTALLAVFFVALVANAQGTTNVNTISPTEAVSIQPANNVRVPKKREVVQERHDTFLKKEQNRRDIFIDKKQNRRENFEDKITERRDIFKENKSEKIEKFREKHASATAEQKEKFKKRRAALTEKVQRRIVNLAANVSNRMDAVIKRFAQIIDRIDARIAKIKEKGVDTALAETHMTESRTHLDKARALIADIDTVVDEITSSETPREGWNIAKARYTDIREALRATHQSLREAVVALKEAVKYARNNIQDNTATDSISSDTTENVSNDTVSTSSDSTSTQ